MVCRRGRKQNKGRGGSGVMVAFMGGGVEEAEERQWAGR